MDRKLPKRSRDVGGKFVSGWEKKKKKMKKANEASANKQKGAIHTFLKRPNLKVKTWPLLERQPKLIQ